MMLVFLESYEVSAYSMRGCENAFLHDISRPFSSDKKASEGIRGFSNDNLDDVTLILPH